MNYRVILPENNYPHKGSSCMLIGIYPSRAAAEFIVNILIKNKLNGIPEIDEVPFKDFPVTTRTVENYLANTKGI
jgi:hypothetical protein